MQMLQYKILAQTVRVTYAFLWKMHIRIKILSNTEFKKLLNELSAEQKLYALYFRLI